MDDFGLHDLEKDHHREQKNDHRPGAILSAGAFHPAKP